MHVRVESEWVIPPDEIERRRARYKKQFPKTQPTTQQFSDLAPRRGDSVEFAYDDRRLFVRQDQPTGPGTFNHRIWDGRQVFIHEKYGPEEHYALDRAPYRFLRDTFGLIGWPRAGPHKTWWLASPDEPALDESFYGKPEHFEVVGRESFRGVDCHVIEVPTFFWRWYVGVADGRLRGIRGSVLPRDNKEALKVVRELARENGHDVGDFSEYYAWLRKQPKELRELLELLYFKRLRHTAVTQTQFYFEDYKEVAPGCWMPMRFGYESTDSRLERRGVPGARHRPRPRRQRRSRPSATCAT